MPSIAAAVNSISFAKALVLLGVVVGGQLLAGLVVIRGRKIPGDESPPGSVIRSWIAISLVMGLLVFCAAAFLIDDSSLRSTLFGGLIANVGAAVAFYFSSKTAEQARADVMTMSQTAPPATVLVAPAPVAPQAAGPVAPQAADPAAPPAADPAAAQPPAPADPAGGPPPPPAG